jgi:hypothetical protein
MSRLDSQTQVIVPVTFIHSLATQSHHPASCLCCLCCICKPLPSLPSLPLLTTPFANHSLWKPFPLQTTPFSPSQNISVLFNTLRAEKRSWEHQARFSPNNLPPLHFKCDLSQISWPKALSGHCCMGSPQTHPRIATKWLQGEWCKCVCVRMC